MIKVLAAAQRHPTNRSIDAFQRYWAETHGPLFANSPQLRRYVQHITLAEAYGNAPDPTYDGASMFWYDDYAPADVAADEPEIQALVDAVRGVGSATAAASRPHVTPLLHEVLKDDVQLFDRSITWPMNQKRASVWARERVIVDGPTAPQMVKAVFIVARLPGLTLHEFFDRWLKFHGPLVAQVAGLRRYVQNHALLEAYGGGRQTHDGWSELWFDDLDALQAAVDSEHWRDVRRDGDQLFSRPVGVCVARERVQKELDWSYTDFGVGELSEADVRLRLVRDGFTTLAGEPGAPRLIKAAASRQALAVWTAEHLVTIDDSRIDARPDQ